MTTPHRTLQMALDALDAITDDVDGTGLNTMPSFDKALDAITALREALNAPEPEPYGHVTTHTVTGQQFFYRYPSPPYLDTAKECIAVYAAPPAAPDHLRDVAGNVAPAAPQAELLTIDQEKALSAEAKTGPFQHTTPVVGNDMQSGETLRLSSKRHAGSTPPVAPAPVVREPLTDEQLAKIAVEDEFLLYCDQESFNEIARAIEAAHGIGGGNG